MKTEEKEHPSLVAEWKHGKNLDCTFASSIDRSKKKVSAHKAIVCKYSTYLKKQINISCQRSYFVLHQLIQFTDFKKIIYILLFISAIVMPYSIKVIKILITLMYEHAVKIDESDYDTIMKAAKTFHVDGMIGRRQYYWMILLIFQHFIAENIYYHYRNMYYYQDIAYNLKIYKIKISFLKAQYLNHYYNYYFWL